MAPLVAVSLLAGALAAPRQAVSMPRDPEEGRGLRRGLGLQVGSFVWHGGVSKPRNPAADSVLQKGPDPQTGPDAWQEDAEEEEEAEGEEASREPDPVPSGEEE